MKLIIQAHPFTYSITFTKHTVWWKPSKNIYYTNAKGVLYILCLWDLCVIY